MNKSLPEGWKIVTLETVAREVRIYEKEPLKNGLERFVGLEHIDPEDLQIHRWGLIKDGTTFTKKFVKGQVLFGRRRAYQKKVGLADFDGLCSGDILVFETTDGLIPELLPFLVQSDNFYDYALDTSAGSLSPRTKWKHLAKYEFPLPPLEEQKRIAEVLWAVEDSIRKTKNAIDVAERYKKVLMRHLFTYGVVGMNEISNIKMKETKIGKIPTTWDCSEIQKIAKVRRGASPRPINDPKYFSEKGRGWVKISDATDTYKYLQKTSQYLSELGASKSVKVNHGDLIMSICATIGKPVLVDMNACIHDGFVLFENVSENINKEFFFYYLLMNEQKFASKKQPGTQGNLNTKIVGKTSLPIPPIETQDIIVELLRKVDETNHHFSIKISSTKQLKSRLLNDLLSGSAVLGGESNV